MAVDSKATKVAFLTPRERLGIKLLFQSKARFAFISILIATPILASSGVAFWLYNQNQVLATSAREVVDELEILDQEIEELSRRAGLPRVRSEGLSSDGFQLIPEGQGGVPVAIEPEAQLKMARQKLPTLTKKLETETKPALEKTLKQEKVISPIDPDGQSSPRSV